MATGEWGSNVAEREWEDEEKRQGGSEKQGENADSGGDEEEKREQGAVVKSVRKGGTRESEKWRNESREGDKKGRVFSGVGTRLMGGVERPVCASRIGGGSDGRVLWGVLAGFMKEYVCYGALAGDFIE